jgi:hypothetical protein
VHAHRLAEKAHELRSVFWIVGLLVTLRLRGEFGDWRYQLAVRTKESGGIGGIKGDPEIDADGPPPRRNRSRNAPTHGRRESSDEQELAQERTHLRVVGLLELLR